MIAAGISRSPSSVSREIRRNHPFIGEYRASVGAWHAKRRSRIPRRKRFFLLRPHLWALVREKWLLCWSPGQISSWLRKTYDDPTMQVSPETLYAALYVLPRGTLRKELTACLRRQHIKRRRSRRGKRDGRGQIPDMVSIHERPPEVEGREIMGHWEGDLLIGSNRKVAIGTLVERTTRYLLLCRVPTVTTEGAWRQFAKRFNELPESLRLTLTYDRGKEMLPHKKLAKAAKVKIYFCDPRCPWQRGTNENTNGLLRQFFPKGTDLSLITTKELRRVEALMNGRPREVLQFATPHEVFTSLRVALGS